MSSITTNPIRRLARALVLTTGVLLVVPALAQTPAKAAPRAGEAAQVKKLLEQRFQGATVGSVTKNANGTATMTSLRTRREANVDAVIG